jgi:hypothetical protein
MPSEEDINDYIAEIWWLLELSGYDELEMPVAIWEEHCRINSDQFMYLAVWERLDSKTRRQFKDWIRLYLGLDEYRRCDEYSFTRCL